MGILHTDLDDLAQAIGTKDWDKATNIVSEHEMTVKHEEGDIQKMIEAVQEYKQLLEEVFTEVKDLEEKKDTITQQKMDDLKDKVDSAKVRIDFAVKVLTKLGHIFSEE